MTKPDYLSFDTSNLDDFSAARLDDALAEFPELMTNHLKIAQYLATLADDIESEGTQDAGYVKGIRDVAAHLRQCDYIPGGDLLPQ